MKKHFYWIDWLRFIAAFMVVVCHVRGHHWMDYANLDKASHTFAIKSCFAFTRAGLEWVVVFFVLSGFLVGGGSISKVLERRFNVLNFTIDRATRIWIPLIPAFALSALVGSVCGIPISVSTLLGNIFAMQGLFSDVFAHNAPLWSLSYEIWFYILIGAIGITLTYSLYTRVSGIILLFISLSVFTRLNAALLGCWLLGAFSWFLISDRKKLGLLIVGLCIGLLGMLLSQLQADSLSFSRNYLFTLLPSRDVASLIESLGIGFLIASICTIVPTGTKMTNFEETGTKLAAWSYTLYLTHFPVLMLIEHFYPARYHAISLTTILLFIVKVAACMLTAWLLYLPFEARTPHIRGWLRERFSNN